jgi:hypothetical protein
MGRGEDVRFVRGQAPVDLHIGEKIGLRIILALEFDPCQLSDRTMGAIATDNPFEPSLILRSVAFPKSDH